LKVRSTTTFVVVTHNIPSARTIGDELVFLHEGRVIARGGPEALDRSDVALVRQFMMFAEGSPLSPRPESTADDSSNRIPRRARQDHQ